MNKDDLEQEFKDLESEIEDYEGQVYSLNISIESLSNRRDEIIEELKEEE